MKKIFSASLLFIIISCNNDKLTQISTILPSLNDRFSVLTLFTDKVPKIDTDAKPIQTITILTKDKVVFPFEIQKYYFGKNKAGISGDTLNILINNICELIDSTHIRGEKVFDILRKTTTTIAFEKAGFSIEQEINTGDFIADLAIFFKETLDFRFKKLRVFIKGYADFSPNDWTDKQSAKYGIFTTIEAHPSIKTGINQDIFYHDYLEKKSFDATLNYKNIDLPNLRAAYLKLLLENIIKKYSPYTQTSVEILDGSEVGDKPDPNQRRGEIIVQIYD